MVALNDIAARLSTGAKGRTEADIQADVRALLLLAGSLELIEGDLEVFLEAPAGGGRRIDVEAGSTVFEVKKSVRPGRALDDAVEQLGTYVRHRTEELSRRHVGVLTDGQTWILYHLQPGGELVEVNRIRMRDRRDGERLVAWLETILATRKEIAPTPREIVQRLGADSPAAQLDLADLRALYAACRGNPEVQVKRELWARLLLSALGAGFEDSDELFVTHTYLVLTAELIAHEVMGLPTDPASTDVRALLEGQQFAMSGLHGVVEADFFDWPATISQGQPVIAAIARRLSLFAWRNVEHDVLKALYESVIDADTRRRLGEYYTPDWLAEKMVAENFQDPMNQRVLDPACGSGTFLFWAVRRALQSCDSAGMDNHAAVAHVVSQIQGMDLHPVAVTLARVTYLLALTPDRLADRDELTVPVFLGDSVRWEQEDTLRSEDGITVRTTDPLEMIEDESKLHFPEGVIDEPQRFDRLVAELANKAAKRKPKTKPPSIRGLLNRHKVTGDEDRQAVEIAFKKLCRLHDSGRDHVWSYYIRNLMRPLSFMRPEGQVDLLIGNPPWLSYRSMPRNLQRTYQSLAKQRGLWAGGKVATNQDLSDLFAARSVEQYLKEGGSFAFVMPHGVLSRRQYRGFRSGDWQPGECGARAQFRAPEDLSKVKPPLFANASCVVSGTKARSARALPASAIEWTGRLSSQQLSWGDASRQLASAGRAVIAASDTHESPYRALFQQGASLVPRMLVTVEEVEGGPIGVTSGRVRVRSARSANEKPPWKSLPGLDGVVERRFVRPMHVGATILAYRARDPQLAI
ncbi:MAG TPA: N-6 DNA methylase, partial [Solirubrobacterales bacterium]|nr:N-6 DNA methylase [Solirubrobacterales bacterium]